ncbi:MAG TPA: glycosyltransferase [Polyangiales bacterium]|nr:glycosyltransferase [Polyangiales bacterium]
MKIFWIGQAPYDEGAGEEVVDRKLKAALVRLGHQIDTYSPKPVSRLREVVNLSLLRMPYYRARFESAESRRAIRAISRDYDAIVASWEPFDGLALDAPKPVVLLLHNITSAAIRSVFPTHPLARLLARRGERWERSAYGDRRVRAVAVLSVADQRYVQSLSRGNPVLYTPPGMPPLAPLAEHARFVPELLLSGTYGWFPKRRDVLAFAREYAGLPAAHKIPVLADGLPEQAVLQLAPRPSASADATQAVRLGLISDRFESGHKLKTAYYIANNAVVLSFADVSKDFEGVPDHAFFIRRIRSATDIAQHVQELSALPQEQLRSRMLAFKAACQERFSWDASAGVLARALEEKALRS